MESLTIDPEKSKNDFKDLYVEKLQRDIRKIKVSQEMGQRYMLFEEFIAAASQLPQDQIMDGNIFIVLSRRNVNESRSDPFQDQ